MRGLEADERHPGKREDGDLEANRCVHRDVLGKGVGETEQQRDSQDGAPGGEQQRVRVRIACVAPGARTQAPPPAGERCQRDGQLREIQREQDQQQRVHAGGPYPGRSGSYTRRVSTRRLEAFADGVLAIAATLLILNVDAQVGEGTGAIGHRLLAIWPS